MLESKSRVVEILLDKYIIKCEDGSIIEANIKGNAKRKSNILVGDYVVIEKKYDKYMITKILDRKNQIIRPPVANIDNLMIVVSICEPVPDFTLLDKELILCFSKNITPIICINKIDLDDENIVSYIKKTYGKLGVKIICTSAKDNIGIDELKKNIKGKVTAFSGNSGVGKSSITKKIIGFEDILIGKVGEKTKRGKHTTKYVKLYEIDNNTYILDTPGFSSYELYDISYKDLKKYYYDFNNYLCIYDDCNHVNEDKSVCAIKENVEKGNIDNGRYERYTYIYQKLKEAEDKKYK